MLYSNPFLNTDWKIRDKIEGFIHHTHGDECSFWLRILCQLELPPPWGCEQSSWDLPHLIMWTSHCNRSLLGAVCICPQNESILWQNNPRLRSHLFRISNLCSILYNEGWNQSHLSHPHTFAVSHHNILIQNQDHNLASTRHILVLIFLYS